MKLRNLLATAGATAIVATALAPVATAQTNLDFGLVEELIEGANCEQVDFALTNLGLVEEGTTRNELAAELRGMDTGIDLGFLGFTLQSQYAGTIADKALDCGIVEEDPFDPFAASSEFLESIGLPGLPPVQVPQELQALSSF